MKLRKYRGFYDNGREQLEIEYYSEHRNYSKNNMEDMKNAYLRKFGFYRKKIIKFIKDRDIFIIFALFVGILTYMVGLRDRAEAEAFENEQNKIKIEEVLKWI